MTPIVHVPDRLILQKGGRLTRNEFGLDVRTNTYKARLDNYERLAEAKMGTFDTEFPGLEAVEWDCSFESVLVEVSIKFKGLINEVLKDPRSTNDVPLQTTTIMDDGNEEGDPVPISVMYYAPSSTWRWSQRNRPTKAPAFVKVNTADFTISPFNPNPHRTLGRLKYQHAERITSFRTEQSGKLYWECQATASLLLEPIAEKSLPG